ncbi:MAG: FtsW/RodA/SpoVE family cell cycle protein [Bacillota bacterium]
MSLSLHTGRIGQYLLPTAVLLVLIYTTYYIKIKIIKEADLLYFIIACMVSIGWLMLLLIDPGYAYKQLKWIAFGCAAFIALLRFLDLFSGNFILKYRIHWLFLTLVLLISPLLFGVEAGGAKSWLQIYTMRFQPAEAAKITFLVFLCTWFKDHGSLRNSWPAWLGTFICVAVLVLQRDLGTALIFYLSFLSLLYLVTGRMKGPVLGFMLLIIGAFWAYFFFPHVRVRIMGWLNPWLEPDRGGYQIIQSLFALANGGIWGMGFGGGMPGVIPEAHTDFVFAVIGEQLGLLGTSGVIALYLFFSFFSLKRSQLIPTLGSRLLSAGLSIIILLQAFIIMGGVTKLIPLTGLPLPFMSYGGSSTLSSFIMLGIIIWLNREKGFVPAITRRRLINVNRLIWILMLSLLINISYWQVVKAPTLSDNPLNPRQVLPQENRNYSEEICEKKFYSYSSP